MNGLCRKARGASSADRRRWRCRDSPDMYRIFTPGARSRVAGPARSRSSAASRHRSAPCPLCARSSRTRPARRRRWRPPARRSRSTSAPRIPACGRLLHRPPGESFPSLWPSAVADRLGDRFLDPRQVDLENRAAVRLAVDRDVAVGLLDGAVDGGKAEAAALARRLGGEERLEEPRARLVVHADAGVADRQHHVGPGLHAHVLAGRLVQIDIGGLDHQLAAARHGVARIGRQVDDHLLHLRRVGFDAPDAGQSSAGSARYCCPSRRRSIGSIVGDDVVEVEHARLRGRAAAERQQVPRQRGGALAGIDDLVHEAAHRDSPSGISERSSSAYPGDDGQHVVEVAGDAAGQPSDRVHFLRVGRLLLELQALADIAEDQDGALRPRPSRRAPARRCARPATSVPLRDTSSDGLLHRRPRTRSRNARATGLSTALASFSCEQFQQLGRRFAASVGARPAGEGLGDRIEEGDAAVAHRVTSTASPMLERVAAKSRRAVAPGSRHPGQHASRR